MTRLSVALCGGLSFVLLAWALLSGRAILWDRAVWNGLDPWRSPPADLLMQACSLLGSGLGLGLLVTFICWWLWRVRPDPLLLRLCLLANLGGALAAWPLKAAFQRTRPLASSSFDAFYFSFPSGHAMAALIFAGCVCWYLGRREPSHWHAPGMFLILTFALLSGLSRIYIGAHYFTDVLAGYAAGLCWLGLCLLTVPEKA